MIQQDYSDIIGMEHHRSDKHPHMSNLDRAAQFSPFSALSGYDDCITEAARLTDEKIELDEETRLLLDQKLQLLQSHISSHPQILFTVFLKEALKTGGSYVTISGEVKRIDFVAREILLTDGQVLSLDDIFSMDGTFFQENMPECRY